MTFYTTIKQLLNTQSLFIASKHRVRWGLEQWRGADGFKKKKVIVKFFKAPVQNLHFYGKAVTLVHNPQCTSGFIFDWGSPTVASDTLFNRYRALCGTAQ